MKFKECPFCGGEARLIEPEEAGYAVECGQCLASSRLIFSLKEDARPLVVEAWNTRVGEQDEDEDQDDYFTED